MKKSYDYCKLPTMPLSLSVRVQLKLLVYYAEKPDTRKGYPYNVGAPLAGALE